MREGREARTLAHDLDLGTEIERQMVISTIQIVISTISGELGISAAAVHLVRVTLWGLG